MPGVHWKDWCWSWIFNILATWCKELTHLKRLWCWERLRAGGEGDNRGWDGWMASLTRWTWVWLDSRSGWWTGRPGVLQFMGSRRVWHDWVTELNWTEASKNHQQMLKFMGKKYMKDVDSHKLSSQMLLLLITKGKIILVVEELKRYHFKKVT